MNTIPTKTNNEAYTDAMLEVQQQIKKLLRWTDDIYSQCLYNGGVAYLHWYLPEDDDARNQLLKSKKYWNWFKTLWMQNDQAFINSPGIEHESLRERLRLYKQLQNPHVLAVEVKPNRIVLSDIKKVPVL